MPATGWATVAQRTLLVCGILGLNERINVGAYLSWVALLVIVLLRRNGAVRASG